MEYVDGIDLKRLTRRALLAHQPLRPELLMAVAVEVLSALEEAHSGGPGRGAPIIHRDLSPENILIARSGAVKVLDFGLAKRVPDARRVPSMEGSMIFGKVRYMPPEQLRGELIDARADLFALGVLLYEALHGEVPFGRQGANQVLGNILAGPPPSPTARHHGHDRDLDAIILRALEPDPDRRFQSAEEMRQALIARLRASRSTMPLESLRKKLRLGAVLGDPFELTESNFDASEALDPHAAPDLSVAERCGKCGGPFSALFLEGLVVDRCTHCRGLWLDRAEVDRILGQPGTLEPAPPEDFTPAPLDALHGSCPTCLVGLVPHDVPARPASLEVCPHCHGIWFDQGEIRLLADPSVVTWLKDVIETKRP